MATQTAFKINGVIDTSKNVLSNIDVLCRASGCWVTYDNVTGLWSVIINRAGNSVRSFNDANIIGSINITGTGIDQLYNSVEVQFPNQDLLNTIDYANFTLPTADRLPNELDKKLTISLDCINNPVQAQYIGSIELKQNRVDKIIQFKSDYTALNLKAGDLIDVTASMYGYNAKVFRITRIDEEDSDDGTIQVGITALEYDANVYNQDGLIYTERTTATGVVPKSMNTALNGIDNNALVSQLAKLDIPSFDNILVQASSATVLTAYNGWISAGYPTNLSNRLETIISFTPDYTGQPPTGSLQWNAQAPYGTWTYTYNGTSRSVTSYYPTAMYVYLGATLIDISSGGMDSGFLSVHLSNAAFGVYNIYLVPLRIYGPDGSLVIPTSFTTPITNAAGGAAKIIGYAFAKNVRT